MTTLPAGCGVFDSPRYWWRLALIVVIGCIAYANSFAVPFQFDDFNLMEGFKPAAGHSLADLFVAGGSRRFAYLTFALDYRLHGEAVFGYHLVNLGIHLAAAVCLYLLVTSAAATLWAVHCPDRSGGDAPGSYADLTALAAALLFVAHPVQTQAVTYIAQRFTSLAALLYLLALLAYLRLRLALLAGERGRAAQWGAVMAGATLLALFSKETAYTLPFMCCGVELFLLRGMPRKIYALALLTAAMVAGAWLFVLFSGGADMIDSMLFSLRHATSENLFSSRMGYFCTELRVIATYLRLLVAPVNQCLDYDFPLYRSFGELPVAASLVLHLALAAVMAGFARYSTRAFRCGEAMAGIALRLASFGIFWFYLALSVESSFFPITDVINEHRLYLPAAGLFLTVAALFGWWGERRRRPALALLGVVVLILTVATVRRNRVWQSDLTLWEDAAGQAPDKPRVIYNIGASYIRRGDVAQALPRLLRAIELSPGVDPPWISLRNGVAMIDRFRGRYDPGEVETPKEWSPARAANDQVFIGLAREFLGDPAGARSAFERSVQLDPALGFGWYNLGLAAARSKDRITSAEALKTLERLDPQLAGALRVMAPP